jgi:hypothetical protein
LRQTFTFHGFRFHVLRREKNRISALRIIPLSNRASGSTNLVGFCGKRRVRLKPSNVERGLVPLRLRGALFGRLAF